MWSWGESMVHLVAYTAKLRWASHYVSQQSNGTTVWAMLPPCKPNNKKNQPLTGLPVVPGLVRDYVIRSVWN